jgi:DNA polymerase-3 subunit beta
MDITISKAELSRALYLTQSIVERKTTMPILVNVLLSASDGELRLSATDLEITAVTSAKASVKSGGSTTVNAKIFSDIVRELPETDLHIKLTEGERLEITANSSKLRIIGASAQEFPSLPGIGFKVESKVDARQLSEMINKTIYAVSTDETRFNLNGVCFEMIAGEKGEKSKKSTKSLRMVATDGHRLAMITRPIGNLDFAERVIVPRKGLSEIRKLLDSAGDGDVGIAVRDGFLVLESRDTKISVRLIDGEFPDYSQVMPKSKGGYAAVDGNELQQALKRAVLLVSDKEKSVRLDFSAGRLRISTSSPELGDASEELPLKYEGKQLSIGFNARYLIDMVSSLGESKTMALELNGELGPGKFYSDGDESYIGIIMPMRLATFENQA